jgi:hypothetical protein
VKAMIAVYIYLLGIYPLAAVSVLIHDLTH